MKHQASENLPFFVYGTLIPGQPNDYLWGNGITDTETAVFANSRLYDMGYYPMLVEKRGGFVHGKLITVTDRMYLETLARLDALEGFVPNQSKDSVYSRVKRVVTICTGRSAVSWIYVGRVDQVGDSPQITGGDWVVYAAAKQSQLATWWESVNTVFGRHGDSDFRGQ